MTFSRGKDRPDEGRSGSRQKRGRFRAIWWAGCLSLTVVPLLLSFVFFLALMHDDANCFDRTAFDGRSWRNIPPNLRDSPRTGMVGDLLRDKLRRGQSLFEVAKLLNESPSAVWRLDEWKGAPFAKQVYVTTLDDSDRYNAALLLHEMIGKDCAWTRGINIAFLRLYFDKDGKYLGGEVGFP